MIQTAKPVYVFEFEKYGGTQRLTQNVITQYCDSKHINEMMQCSCRQGTVLMPFTAMDGKRYEPKEQN